MGWLQDPQGSKEFPRSALKDGKDFTAQDQGAECSGMWQPGSLDMTKGKEAGTDQVLTAWDTFLSPRKMSNAHLPTLFDCLQSTSEWTCLAITTLTIFPGWSLPAKPDSISCLVNKTGIFYLDFFFLTFVIAPWLVTPYPSFPLSSMNFLKQKSDHLSSLLKTLQGLPVVFSWKIKSCTVHLRLMLQTSLGPFAGAFPILYPPTPPSNLRSHQSCYFTSICVADWQVISPL